MGTSAVRIGCSASGYVFSNGIDMTDVILREATENDISALRQLEQELIEFERPFDRCIIDSNITYYDLASLITSSDSVIVVADVNAEIVACGYAQIRASKPCFTPETHCYLGFIYVKPQSRGKGLSRQIIDSLTNWAKSCDVRYFLLDVYSENSGAVSAYQRFGFKPLSLKMELEV